MQTTYIFGHKKPDTDSVTACIALSYLKNMLGEDTEPRLLGTINKETAFVLNYFNVEEPRFLSDVKVQMRNMKFNQDAKILENASIDDTFKKMNELGVTGLPLIDKSNVLTGYANLKEIARYLIEGNVGDLYTSYDNIVKTLNGRKVLKFDDEIKGSILAASYRSTTFLERVKLTKEQVLIVGDREPIQEYAILSKVKLMIIVGGNTLNQRLYVMAKENHINVIETGYTTYKTANILKISNYIKMININKDPIKFYLHDYRKDFLEIANKYGHTNYPIVNKKNECLGMIQLIDANNYEKKKVILVDHNQLDQTVDGIEEAEILEIIDHHNLGNIATNSPINFRIMPVGCTSTILYKMFKENHIEIPKNIAGLMASAIISDTLLFKSPTTTNYDKEVCLALCEIAGIDPEKYGMEMFKSGSSIRGMTVQEIFNQDFKTYKAYDSSNLGISQVFTMDFDSIEKDKNEYIELLNSMHDMYNYKVAVLCVTDIIRNGSYLFYNEEAKELLQDSYNLKDIYQGIYIDNLVSRKKQMLPLILESIARRA
ncbi:MAG: putative manganese-dependent inorganic diphosphatase [Bacilli bacterium]